MAADHLLSCDLCDERATVAYLIGKPGLYGLPEMNERMWTARCHAHPSRSILANDTIAVGITTVVGSA